MISAPRVHATVWLNLHLWSLILCISGFLSSLELFQTANARVFLYIFSPLLPSCYVNVNDKLISFPSYSFILCCSLSNARAFPCPLPPLWTDKPLLFHRLFFFVSWFSCYFLLFLLRVIPIHFHKFSLSLDKEITNNNSSFINTRELQLLSFGPFGLCVCARFGIHVHLSLKSNRINYNLNYLTFWLWFHKSFSRFFFRRIGLSLWFFLSVRKSITIATLYLIVSENMRKRKKRQTHNGIRM